MKPRYRTFFLSVVLIIIYSKLFAQAPFPKQWDYRFGGTKNDVLSALQPTTDGGYILGGWSNSEISGDKAEASQGGYDYWLVKIDAAGTKQWDKRFGGTKDDYATSVEQTADGGYLLGGYSSSGIGGDRTEGSRGAQDYWIVKTDASGNKQWDKRFGGPLYDYLYTVLQTPDGGYLLGGYSYSEAGGDKSQPSRGGIDYWIVKINADGTKQWDKRFGGTADDRFASLQATTDGSYVLGGSSNSDAGGDISEAGRGGFDYWVVKINANGIQQSDKRFGGTADDFLTSLAQTTDGGYALAGYSLSGAGADKRQPGRGKDDYWLVKTNAAGVKLWDERYGGGNIDYLNAFTQTSDGGFILGGSSFSGIGGDKSEASRGDYDCWLVKTDLRGRKQWDARFGGTNGDELHAIWQTKDEGYLLGGASVSPVSGDKTQPKWGNANNFSIYDYWLVKLGSLPGSNSTAQGKTGIGAIGSAGVTTNAVTVSPNPSHGTVSVSYTTRQPGNVQIRVFDHSGKAMLNKNESAVAGKNTYLLHLSNLANGVYELQINNGTEQKGAKFVIER